MERTQAIAFLDRWWPAARGEIVTAEQAREMLLESHSADQFLQYDVARQDAMLINLIGGGLLQYGPTQDRALSYVRPMSDELPTPNPPAEAMFHPMDGSDPIPYREHLRRLAEKAAAPKLEPTTGPLPPWASLIGTDLRIDLTVLGADVETVTVTPQTRKSSND